MKFRPLTAEEVECRIGSTFADQGAVTLLLYKTSRTDMALLDEVVGGNNWQSDYEEIHGNLFCRLSVWDSEKNEWITKTDCGIESQQTDDNAKKAEASDALKRAGFQVGIGRELYTAPLIWIRGIEFKGKIPYKDGKRLRPKVEELEVTDGKITFLIITSDGQVIFKYGKTKSNDEALRRISEAIHVS